MNNGTLGRVDANFHSTEAATPHNSGITSRQATQRHHIWRLFKYYQPHTERLITAANLIGPKPTAWHVGCG